MNDKELAKVIGKNVSDLRKQYKKKWEEFENDTNVFHSTVTNWKNGTVPKIDQLYNICNAYDVSLDWLIGKSNSQRVSNTPITYSDWINTLENWINTDVVKEFYRPELDSKVPDKDLET